MSSATNHKQQHWEQVYQQKQPEQVSWYQPESGLSLQLIQQYTSPDASLIDVGSGATGLIGDLIKLGYHQLTALDISAAALQVNQQRLGDKATLVQWLVADITKTQLPAQAYDLWHDRAVFHFLTEKPDRESYVNNLKHSLKTGGYLLISCFSEQGPEKCSGLPVVRYNTQSLAAEFGDNFVLKQQHNELHHTPFGTSQAFLYLLLQKV
ncbi:class I SAM-dependent methyltransferase [Rheinheimera sp. 4Y26]|uniref:class I SAM-dependent methyltransferase n=1 Tax=Rheinheimera sp. 4Y26 TaxID=2977811 RepID=UPI0021B11427|nr:class I SAM-dependent methyltransferase [Rheinheimera sp. 4Y26]MCT6699791.1 class I SAM-dependent methyltransferase [Rheinheimera sp. 4Y26]